MKHGLALSGGAMRGFAHAGVLSVLERAGYKPDIVAGTSAGAVIGALYIRGFKPKELILLASRFTFLKVMRFDMPFDGLSNSKGVKKVLEPYLGGVEFSDLEIPLLVATTDLKTGKPVILEKGLVIDALAASVAVPGFINPVKYGKYLLIDGAFSNPLPIKPLKDHNVERVIAVDLNHLPPQIGASNMINTVARSTDIMMTNLIKAQSMQADVLIKVPTYAYDPLSDKNVKQLYLVGARAARRKLVNIKKLINKK